MKYSESGVFDEEIWDFENYSKMEKLFELKHEYSRNIHLLLIYFVKKNNVTNYGK